jgi:hypothetical protein
VKFDVFPADAAFATAAYAKYSSPVPLGVRFGKVTVVDAALLIPPEVSTLHVEFTPVEAENSWASNPVCEVATLDENVTAIVDAPVVLTSPVHISRS